MSNPFRALEFHDILNAFRMMRTSVKVQTEFPKQVEQIDCFLAGDNTGLINTLLDFMVHTATVPMNIEVGNDGLNEALELWQTQLLNKDFNIDIARGLRDLSVQYYKERWRSSMVGLKIRWGTKKFGDTTFSIPEKMWILNGRDIKIISDKSLETRKYALNLGKGKSEILKNTPKESIYIRRPYEAWNKATTNPFLVKRGVLYNGLLKKAILEKQADTIESIIFYMFLIRAGSDKLAEMKLLPTKEELGDLEEQVIKAQRGDLDMEGLKNYIAKLRYDVNFEHLVPEIKKVINEDIIKPIDQNILSGLGLIELEGFGDTRQEAILNPKVMVEEVVDAVFDWADLISNIMMEMMDRNRPKHRNLANNKVEVIPGVIQAFVDDKTKTMFRSLYDRGLLSKETSIETLTRMINSEVEIQRRKREDEAGLQSTMKPPIIQNLEQFEEPSNLEDQGKQPGSPEADNFNQAAIKGYFARRKKDKDYKKRGRKKNKKCDPKKDKDCPGYKGDKDKVTAPFNNIDELPNNVTNVLPIPAQMIWLRVFNSIFEDTGNETRARKGAWAKVKEKYKKVPGKKLWIKK